MVPTTMPTSVVMEATSMLLPNAARKPAAVSSAELPTVRSTYRSKLMCEGIHCSGVVSSSDRSVTLEMIIHVKGARITTRAIAMPKYKKTLRITRLNVMVLRRLTGAIGLLVMVFVASMAQAPVRRSSRR